MSAPDVLILGGGRFGRLAAQRLGSRAALVVEPEPSPELIELGIPLRREMGATAVAEILAGHDPPAWIVPTYPGHFLRDWLLLALAGHDPRKAVLPSGMLPDLPFNYQGRGGEVYLSLADFQCPDDCPEPADTCTVTGLPRGEPLYERLAGIDFPGWRIGVLRSRQLAPGVGGLKSREMLELAGRMTLKGGKWLVAASCRCHAAAGGLILRAEA